MDNQTATADFADLAQEQAALAASLASQSEAPEGFDASRVSLAAELLISKRRRAAANAWPILATILGNEYRPRFSDYARGNPMTAGMTPRDDALCFARHLASNNQLPDPALRLLAMAETRLFFPTRRGPFISMRLPLLGTFTFRVLRR